MLYFNLLLASNTQSNNEEVQTPNVTSGNSERQDESNNDGCSNVEKAQKKRKHGEVAPLPPPSTNPTPTNPIAGESVVEPPPNLCRQCSFDAVDPVVVVEHPVGATACYGTILEYLCFHFFSLHFSPFPLFGLCCEDRLPVLKSFIHDSSHLIRHMVVVDQWQVRQLPIGLVNHQKFQHNHKRHKEFKDPQHKKLNKLKQHKERLDNKLNHNKDRKLHQKIKSPKENQVGHLLVLGTIINK
ncbi:hypothetical protein JHK85_004904 [Glycine max]|nr:hypothetical protein JHK87_004569 [Glycine soja]KAG5063721.1 hypothetical protein JHK85_004904 [Glycine max]